LHLRLQTTMIYVTHDQTEAMTLGNRIAVMKDGQIQQIGEPLEVYEKPVNKFVAGFIGNPPMNFMKGKIVKKDSEFYFDEGELFLKVPREFSPRVQRYVSQEVIMGVRPEHIHDKLFFPEAPREITCRVRCEVVEPMGVETHLHLSTSHHTFICRTSADNRPAIGQDLDVVFEMSKAKFFDKDTEKSIV